MIVDDQRLFREMLAATLRMESDVDVVEVDGGEEAVRLAAVWPPDVALVDVEMPGLDGIGVTRRLRDRLPQVRVVVLTGFEQDAYVLDAVTAGACGYLLKDVSPERVVEAVRQAHAGQSPLDPRVASRLLCHLLQGAQGAPPRPSDPGCEALSARERDVARLIGRNMSNRDIARHLCLSENTVKVHVSSVLRKLGVSDRVGIAVFAVRSGMLEAG